VVEEVVFYPLFERGGVWFETFFLEEVFYFVFTSFSDFSGEGRGQGNNHYFAQQGHSGSSRHVYSFPHPCEGNK
jgi:hypothetical protein